ncbi:UDP-N-acetylglucosamine--N-acetylmuramyl-(pentapeptide) pyrophosphoryl-undecaprenol N-acetylglucosamine transferase [Fundidesulfovibrio magnetotacticus]|uniref:UDP-N-acetylglucosamine--N-acetylmuramyl-(Pentapeptide) pyrophosphoryl-undecaprenol N-acetylglucosamine transferase n=1 Tax=Fundidesulfovibrio magnetotacticus TaxID=2730080 RepID=A0A6V8LQN3_9BACT|nr:glycosyltransferase [Fundidesulfovibrio magnetotacticus]GFK93290.1 UDP-N-acetylglucosamine--N-acetylmuramyl-(pentapeptide) pyrophosphoryl-undecaprenol N-acetylglucosamine transferase [Fundidesulfovibrio magnetotacticus]
MVSAPTFNILMYSHDTYGLGHIRRTMAIAQHLRGRGVNVLILTGSPLVGRFDFPDGVDFVRIPGMIKRTNEEYQPLSIRLSSRHALNIRRNIVVATAKAFQPHLFIVDKAPLGLKREVLPTLKWLKRRMPQCRTILGLRDIMDDAESTRAEWREKGIYDVLDRYYSEIWVYGNREYYDPVEEYAIPEAVSSKMVFTGYIPRALPKRGKMALMREEESINRKERLVLVTTGGGGDGYPLMDAYLSMLESMGDPPFRSILVSGPFMPKPMREEVHARAQRVKARFHHFHRRMEALMGLADVVVSMGGYNTTCEVLSLGKPSLVVPREEPRLEQRIRAEMFQRHGFVEFLPWSGLTPASLGTKVLALIDNPKGCCPCVNAFRFSGLDVISQRMAEFRGEGQ